MTDSSEPFEAGQIVRRHLREASRHLALADPLRGVDDATKGLLLGRARLRIVTALATIDRMIEAWDESSNPTTAEPLTTTTDGATIRTPR